MFYEQALLYGSSEQYAKAIASYDKALEFKPDEPDAFYNKACCYALNGQVDSSIQNLQRAIALNPHKYREMAKTDSDFDSLRSDTRFQVLIQEYRDMCNFTLNWY